MAQDKNNENGFELNNIPADDDDFSVDSFAELLNSVAGDKKGSVDLKADDEEVIEPLDVDSGSEEGASADHSNLSGDAFLDMLYGETKRDISNQFDALTTECRTFVPDDAPIAPKEEKPVIKAPAPKPEQYEDVSSSTPRAAGKAARAASFSDAVKAAMEAEGGYGTEEKFVVSLDNLDGSAPEEEDPYITPAAPVRRNEQPVKSNKSVDGKKTAAGKKKKKKKGFFAGLLPSREDSTFEIFRKCLFLVSVITMVACLGSLGNTYLYQPYVAGKTATSLTDIRSDEMSSWEEVNKKYDGIKFPDSMRVNLAEYYAINNSFYGYLEVAGTSISMPVVQGGNNEYYLKHDFYRKWTKYGCPFVNYRNSAYGLDRNTSIFGHNMEYDDLIFGDLEKYRTIDGFKKAPIIELETLYQKYTFKVYAVFVTSAKNDSNGWIFNYIFTQLSDPVFEEYIAQMDQRKFYSTGVDINKSDKILTLSTCSYDFSDERLVVVGRLVRDGESTEVDTSKAVANSNPRYPNEWYAKKGKKNPYASASKWVPHS